MQNTGLKIEKKKKKKKKKGPKIAISIAVDCGMTIAIVLSIDYRCQH